MYIYLSMYLTIYSYISITYLLWSMLYYTMRSTRPRQHMQAKYLPPNSASQSFLKPLKIDAKSHSIFGFIFQWIFDAFFIDLFIFRSFKIMVFPKEKQGFLKISPLAIHIHFSFDFVANLPPFSLPKSTNIALKINLERYLFFDAFLHWFFLDFASALAANLAQLGSQDGPGRRQKPSWRHPKSREDATWKRKRPGARFSIDLGWILGGFLMDFWWIWHGFLMDF